MEEKKINNYIVLLEKLEKMLIDSVRDDVKEYIEETYVSIIYELAITEKRELSYYKEKMENINISKERINDVLEKIRQKLNIPIIEEPKKEFGADVPKLKQNEEIEKKYNLFIDKLKEDLINPNDLAIKTWLRNFIDFINNNKDYFKTANFEEIIKNIFVEQDKKGLYNSKINSFINEITLPREIKPSLTKEEDSSLKINNLKKSNLPNESIKTLNVLALTDKKSWSPKSIICYIIFKLYKNKEIKNQKLISFLEKNGYYIVDNKLIDVDGNNINEEYVEKAKAKYIKDKLFTVDDSGTINKGYKKDRFTSILLNMKQLISLKRIKKQKSEEKIKDEDNIDIIKGMGKC